MLCYRIAPAQVNNVNTALSGVGGLYAEGRWHFIGNPVVYSASSRALAMLERLVNDSTDILSTNLSICTFLIPDSIAIDKLEVEDLPQNWDDHPYINDTQQLGSQWLQQGLAE